MYRIDHAREICAQLGLGDAIMIYKQPENRVDVDICVVGGSGRGFARDLAVL